MRTQFLHHLIIYFLQGLAIILNLKIEILNGGHTLPICRNMFNSIKFVEDNYYDFFFFLEFDNLFSESDLLKLDSFREQMIENNQELLFFRPESFRECDSYVYETLMFGGCPKFFLDKFQPPRNFTEWLRVNSRTPLVYDALNKNNVTFSDIFIQQRDENQYNNDVLEEGESIVSPGYNGVFITKKSIYILMVMIYLLRSAIRFAIG